MTINIQGMTKDDLIRTIESLAFDAYDNYKETFAGDNTDRFNAGIQIGYYEVLDMLVSRIKINGGEMDDIETPPDMRSEMRKTNK